MVEEKKARRINDLLRNVVVLNDIQGVLLARRVNKRIIYYLHTPEGDIEVNEQLLKSELRNYSNNTHNQNQ